MGGKPPWTALFGADRSPRCCWEQRICYKVLGSSHELRRWGRDQWPDIRYTLTCTHELLEIASRCIMTLVSWGNCRSNLKLNLPICDWVLRKTERAMIVTLLSVVQWSYQLVSMHIVLIAGVSWCQAYKWDPVCMFLLQEKNYKNNCTHTHCTLTQPWILFIWLALCMLLHTEKISLDNHQRMVIYHAGKLH